MALQRAREAILITDDTLRTQYANKAAERLLNTKLVSAPEDTMCTRLPPPFQYAAIAFSFTRRPDTGHAMP